MPTVQQHIAQWKHNRTFAKSIDKAYQDWQVTVIFYAALHLVNAALVTLKEPVSNHSDRNLKVKTNSAFASIRRQYLDLYRIAWITRYDADPQQWLPEEYLTVQDLVDDLLKPIENGLSQLLPKAAMQGPLELKT